MLTIDSHNNDLWEDDVENYPLSDLNRNDIKRLGDVIAADNLFFSDEPDPAVKKIFLDVNTFIESYLYPMRSIRGSVAQHMHRNGIKGIKTLKKAYPNYFGNVEYFKSQLKEITLGKNAIEFSNAPKAVTKQKLPKVVMDTSWMRGTRMIPSAKFKDEDKNKGRKKGS